MLKSNKLKGLVWIFVCVFLLSTTRSQAQDDSQSKFSKGIKVGGNFSTLTSDYVSLKDGKPGYQAGIFVMYRLTSLFALEADAMFASVGCDVIDPAKVFVRGTPGIDRIVKTSIDIKTIQVPVVLNIYALDRGNVKTRLIVGPELNYYLLAHATSKHVEATGETESYKDISSNLQNYDIGAVVGIGFDFKNLFNSLSLEVKYRTGITPVNYIQNVDYKDFGMNVLSLNIGLSF